MLLLSWFDDDDARLLAFCFVYSAGATSVHSLGRAQVRTSSVRARGALHRRLLRLRAISHPCRRRGVGAGTRRPSAARLRQTRAVGSRTSHAHQAVGPRQVGIPQRRFNVHSHRMNCRYTYIRRFYHHLHDLRRYFFLSILQTAIKSIFFRENAK